MRAILYNFKYILLLSLFNIFLSLYINKDNLDLQNTIIDIPDNHMTNINLKKNQNITLSIPYENDKDLLLSINSLNNKTFSFSSDNEFINKNNSNIYRKSIEKSKLNNESKTLIIDINSNDDNNLEIINIIDYDYFSKYHLINKDNEKINVDYPNFVRFFKQEEENVKIEINFNDDIHPFIYYLKVKLSTDDTNYIPRVFNLDKNIYNYTEEELKEKKKTIDIDKEFKDDPQGNKDCKIIAFIFSVKTNSNIKYSVTITIEGTNWFLIGSIILALIFAVITFFLIRRKKNVNETNEEEGEYNVNKQDEGEGEGENPN